LSTLASLSLTFFRFAQENPSAGHDMAGVDDNKDESGEADQVGLPLLRIFFKSKLQEEL